MSGHIDKYNDLTNDEYRRIMGETEKKILYFLKYRVFSLFVQNKYITGFEIIYDEQDQLKGIDVILRNGKIEILVDIKTKTSQPGNTKLKKKPGNTFSFEAETNPKGYKGYDPAHRILGLLFQLWPKSRFYEKHIKTQYLLLIDIDDTDATSEKEINPNNIHAISAVLVKVSDIYELFDKLGYTPEQLYGIYKSLQDRIIRMYRSANPKTPKEKEIFEQTNGYWRKKMKPFENATYVIDKNGKKEKKYGIYFNTSIYKTNGDPTNLIMTKIPTTDSFFSGVWALLPRSRTFKWSDTGEIQEIFFDKASYRDNPFNE